MSLREAVKVKMMQVETAAADLDKVADYDEGKVIGFYLKALAPGGKTYEFQINGNDAAFAPLLAGFTKLVQKHSADARATLAAVGL